MLSKSISRARTAVALGTVLLLAASCSLKLPWRDEPVGDEVNIAFVVERNLLYVPSVTIDNRAGRFFFSTAAPRTVLDPRFMSQTAGRHSIELNERASLRTSPVALGLGAAGDAMIGADVWDKHAVTVDYHAGLLTYQKAGIFPGLMTLYNFTGEPKVNVIVNGREISAIVDTASPNTLELPAAKRGRGRAHVAIAGSDFGDVDVAYSPGLAQPRLGNRLLAYFLVSIDYGRGVVGLWRDPRNR
jgi:hypothetical protein